MPSTYSRRNRLSYSVDLDRVKQASDQTLGENVNRDGNSNSTNIRMTPFRHQRTDYTYGDSGSYRKDRLKDAWISPEMARWPLHSEATISSSSAVLNHSSSTIVSEDMYSRVLSKRLSASHAKRAREMNGEPDGEEESSSRRSVSSSRSSTRQARRSRCRQVAGDWCTHAECASTVVERRMTTDTQRNTNNTPVSTPALSPTKERRARRSSRLMADTSTFSDHHRHSSNHLASSSSTYVYTYSTEPTPAAPQLSKSSPSFERGDGPTSSTHLWGHRRALDTQDMVNRFRQSAVSSGSNNWLARHIFGLEKSSNCNQPSSFSSSDLDEGDEAPYRPRRLPHDPNARYNGFSENLSHYARTVPLYTVTLLLMLIYGCYKCVHWLSTQLITVIRRLWHKTFAWSDSPGSEKLAVHPRLFQFDSRVGQDSSTDSQQGLLTDIARTIVLAVSWLRSVFWRLLAWLCFLLPLLFLLVFLFAPAAPEEDKSARYVLPFVSDGECRRALPDSLASNASKLQIARWRFRCLYHVYVLRTIETRRVQTSFADWFTQLGKWWYRSSASSEQALNWQPDLSGNVDIAEQLTSLSKLIDQRLTQLANSLRQTDSRLSNLELTSQGRLDTVFTRLQHVQSTLDEHIRSSRDLDGTVDTRNLTAMLRLVNETIASHLISIRAELTESRVFGDRDNETASHELNILLNQLRQQLMDRLHEAETQVAHLNAQLRSELTNHSLVHVNVARSLDDLRTLVDQLTTQLSWVKQAQSESRQWIEELKLATRQCSETQAQNTEQCKQFAINSAQNAILDLSERLKAELNIIIQQTILKQLNRDSMDPKLRLQMDELITKISREVLDKTLSEKSADTPIDTSLGHLTIQHLIDKALEKYAADRTGMADFALESAGGTVVSTRCTRTYTDGAAVVKLFGIPLVRLSNSANTILQPASGPGDCWPFHGSSGQVVIRLYKPIVVTAVSLEHLARSLAPNGQLSSAPREFQIKALTSEKNENGVVLGSFVYSIDGPPIQTFEIHNQPQTWQYIQLDILSNHGNPTYTCVYRLRVHGQPAQT